MYLEFPSHPPCCAQKATSHRSWHCRPHHQVMGCRGNWLASIALHSESHLQEKLLTRLDYRVISMFIHLFGCYMQESNPNMYIRHLSHSTTSCWIVIWSWNSKHLKNPQYLNSSQFIYITFTNTKSCRYQKPSLEFCVPALRSWVAPCAIELLSLPRVD